MLTEREMRAIKPTRYMRKVSDGGGLHLLVTPKGQWRWRYNYRFARKYRSLSLGVYPILSLEDARSQHVLARKLLDHGLDPAALKAAVGKHLFAVIMREWAALTRSSSLSRLCHRSRR